MRHFGDTCPPRTDGTRTPLRRDGKGKVRQAAGALASQDELKRDGEAQQAKAAAQREVAVKEGEAEKARAQARVHEAEQRSHQD